MSAAREAVRRAALAEEVAPVIYLGPRGIGKTALLRYLRQQADDSAIALHVEPVEHMTLTERLAEQFERLRQSAQTFSDRAKKKLSGAIESLPKLSFALPHDAGSIEISGRDHEEHSEYVDPTSLSAMLRALQEAARIDRRFLLILLDEMHSVDVRSMRELAAFVNGSAFEKRPVLLAGAGLPEVRDLMDQKLKTYTSRWKSFELRLLTRDETVEAIRRPIIEVGETIDEAALDVLATESFGYPYFIQAYGSAAWSHHRGRRVALADVDATLPEVRQRNEYVLYTRPFSRLTAREMAFVFAMVDSGASPVRIGDIAKALGTDTTAISSTRTSLQRKSIIDVPTPGWLDFRIPFSERYLREHRRELEDEDVVKYRETLRARTGAERTRPR